jgi:hypothetical protein
MTSSSGRIDHRTRLGIVEEIQDPDSLIGAAIRQIISGEVGPSFVTSIAPVGGSYAGGDVVVITGTGFTQATGVTFGGVAGTAFSVDSDTQITVTAPAHAVGAVSLVVDDPSGNSAPTTFTYGPPLPVITPPLAPATGLAAGGTPVVITGTGFTGATSVTFAGAAGTAFSVVSDTVIHVTTPAHAAGAVAVVVVAPQGNSTSGTFTYT